MKAPNALRTLVRDRFSHGCFSLWWQGASFDRSGGQTRDDAALEDQHEQDQWNGDDDGSGHDRAERQFEAARSGNQRQAGGNGTDRIAERERQREEEFVPRRDEGEKPGAGECWCQQREIDLPDHRPGRTAVHPGRVLELRWDLADEAGHHPDRERQAEDHVGQDKAAEAVIKPEPADRTEQAGQHDDLRKHRRAENAGQNNAAAAKLPSFRAHRPM